MWLKAATFLLLQVLYMEVNKIHNDLMLIIFLHTEH